MKYSNALKKVIKEGYKVTDDFNGFIASKEGNRDIEVQRNGREDAVASIKVTNSYPKTLKRALHLSATLGK